MDEHSTLSAGKIFLRDLVTHFYMSTHESSQLKNYVQQGFGIEMSELE